MELSQDKIDEINRNAIVYANSRLAAEKLIGLDIDMNQRYSVNEKNAADKLALDQLTPAEVEAKNKFDQFVIRKGFTNDAPVFQGALGKPVSNERAALPNTTVNSQDIYRDVNDTPTLLPQIPVGDASQYTTFNQTPLFQGDLGKPVSNEQGLMPNTTRPGEDYYNEMNAIPSLLPQINLGSIPIENPELSANGIRPFLQETPLTVSPLDPGPQDPGVIQLQDSGGRADIEINGPTRESTIPLTGVNAPPQGKFINGEFIPDDKLEIQKAGEGIRLDAPPEVISNPLSQIDDSWAKFVRANQSDQVTPQDLNFGKRSNVQTRAMNLLKRIGAIG